MAKLTFEESLRNHSRVPDLIPGAVFVDTQSDTLYELGRDRAKQDPAFAKSIIEGYAQGKLRKGKGAEEIDEKLDALDKAITDNKLGPYSAEIQEAKASIRTRNATQSSVLANAPTAVEDQDRPALSFGHQHKKDDHNHIGWR